MKPFPIRFCVGLILSLVSTFAAEPAKNTSPGDAAAAAFFKLRDDKEAVLNPARIQQLQGTGLGFLTDYPTHGRAGSVISALATFGGTIRDKKLAALRDYWGSQLNYEIVNRLTQPGLSDEAQLVLTALDAAYAGHEAKASRSRDRLDNFRGKIDQLAALDKRQRFLPGQERDYLLALYALNAKQGEAHARQLAAHPEKKLATIGQEELNLIEMGKQPLELKAVTLAGPEFDAGQLRGKVIYFLFWSTTNEPSQKELAALKDLHKRFQKLGLEIITVAHDTDRAPVEKFVKAKGYAWPVLFDGLGAKGEFSSKLNIGKVPGSALFNQQGIFVSNTVRTDKLESELGKLGIKQK